MSHKPRGQKRWKGNLCSRCLRENISGKTIQFGCCVNCATREEKLIAKGMRARIPASPRQAEYQAYLQTEHWKIFRLSILAKRGALCEECRDYSRGVEVHHLTYARRGAELETDVKILCRQCHQRQHSKDLDSKPKGSLVGGGSRFRPRKRNSSLPGSPTEPSARPMYGEKREGSGVAVSTLTRNRPGSEYPGQAGA